MGFDNQYPNRKDKRKPYRKSAKCDRSCRPGGDCPWCQGNRSYNSRKKKDAAKEQEKEL